MNYLAFPVGLTRPTPVNLTRIYARDALKVKDLSDATVILLYMGNEFNALLKPILLKQLKPGTRIVSHRFVMGDDWKPEKTDTITGKDGDRYLIHLWKIEKK